VGRLVGIVLLHLGKSLAGRKARRGSSDDQTCLTLI